MTMDRSVHDEGPIEEAGDDMSQPLTPSPHQEPYVTTFLLIFFLHT